MAYADPAPGSTEQRKGTIPANMTDDQNIVCAIDPLERYQRLHAFYVKHKLDKEAKWVKIRMDKISAAE